jgi:hypothetical protein
VIGVHTLEFSFEHEIDRVRRAVKERGIDYRVAADNVYAIWTAFGNRYWPALYFVDTDGVIRDDHYGEGRYEQSERTIQRLVDRAPAFYSGVENDLHKKSGTTTSSDRKAGVDQCPCASVPCRGCVPATRPAELRRRQG